MDKESRLRKIVGDLEGARRYTNTDPTQQEKDDDTYQKGSFMYEGLSIAVENPKGSVRSGVDADGNKWESRLTLDYGEVENTISADGDPVDVFIHSEGDSLDSDIVYVVNQAHKTNSKKFDEHKVMIGFRSWSDARRGYLSNYDAGWEEYVMSIVPMSVIDFKNWLDHGDTSKPVVAGFDRLTSALSGMTSQIVKDLKSKK